MLCKCSGWSDTGAAVLGGGRNLHDLHVNSPFAHVFGRPVMYCYIRGCLQPSRLCCLRMVGGGMSEVLYSVVKSISVTSMSGLSLHTSVLTLQCLVILGVVYNLQGFAAYAWQQGGCSRCCSRWGTQSP